jgi:hypothetical protein
MPIAAAFYGALPKAFDASVYTWMIPIDIWPKSFAINSTFPKPIQGILKT